MGQLKETRKKDKQKKMMLRVAGLGGLGVVLAGLIIAIGIMLPDAPSGGVSIGGSQQESSQTESNLPGTEESSQEESQSETVSETESETEPESIPEPEPQEVQLVMVGDMLMHDKVIASGKKEDGSYNYDHIFANVKDIIQAADLAIVNQETIMGGEEFGYSGYPRFNTPYALADAEAAAGFDVVLLATNHTCDKGEQAVWNCMNYFDTYHPEMAYIGVNKSQEDQTNNIYVVEKNGIKIAILNYTYTMNGNRIPKDKPWLVNLLKEDKLAQDIQKAEQIADFTIVCPHWGTEYSLGISSAQTKWMKICLENGADLIMGAHPHVIEPIRWETDDQGHKMLVYYSVGNFVNGTGESKSGVANRMVGGIAQVTIGRNEAGEVVILNQGVQPLICHVSTGTAYTVYRIEDYTEELAKENRILSQDSAFSLKYCQDLVKKVWGDSNALNTPQE